jgi:hypothetical protein
MLAAGLAVASFAVPRSAVAAPARGSQEVVVVNDDAAPVPVRNVGEERREPFQAQFNFTVPMGFVVNGGGVFVPAGKRFVVEYASVYVRDFTTRTVVQAYVETTSSTGPVRHRFVPTRTGNDSGPAAITVGAQQMKLYGNGGHYVSVYVEISSAVEGDAQVEASVSGYMVDVP